MSALDKLSYASEMSPIHYPVGVVLDVVGLVIEIGGIRGAVGECLEILTDTSTLLAEVVGFRSGRLLATALGALSGIGAGARVVRSARGGSIAVGDKLLGRVLNAFADPIDGEPLGELPARYALKASPPDPFQRLPIERVFSTGVRVLDGVLTIGVGQRLGIFSGAGVGKSTLLGMVCRSSEADVNVVGLIGERGRELNDFVRNALGKEGLARSVVVAATSDQPPLVRARGAETATAIAEYFRDQGKSVLLVMDSVTRFAMALREAALAAGEPPATKGYPPSVFAALPRLLERAGTGPGRGVITALYTVFVEGDDLSDPIADAVRAILDGHIVLSRRLAEKAHFPAVDVLQSVSRLALELMAAPHAKLVARARELLGVYRDTEDLIQVGAYVPGSDPRVDTAVKLTPGLDQFLRQRVDERTVFGQTVARLQTLIERFEAER